MPKVSVIIPCYNDGAYLPEAIASARNQTFRDLEIIVVNDGSTDSRTLEILENIADEKIKVIHRENGHLSAARNTGIAASKGEIIVTLDADDKFHRSFINEAVEILDNNHDVGIVSSHVQNFGANNKVWRSTAFDDFSFLVENRIVACSAFRKKCWEEVGGYDEKMKNGLEDWEFWIRVTQKGWKVHVIPKKLFYYRKKENSMLVDTTSKISEVLDYMLSKHKEWFLNKLSYGMQHKLLINKQILTKRRIIGLLWEKIRNKF